MPRGLAPTRPSAFAHHQIDEAALGRAPLAEIPFTNGAHVRSYSAINQPNCQVIIEDFLPGEEFDWTFVHDEFQYCLSGKIALTVYLAPLYSEKTEVEIGAGGVYTFPLGARMHVKVLGDQPYRHICFCPPSPDYPFPTVEELSPP